MDADGWDEQQAVVAVVDERCVEIQLFRRDHDLGNRNRHVHAAVPAEVDWDKRETSGLVLASSSCVQQEVTSPSRSGVLPAVG
jgi:hypothetical protein